MASQHKNVCHENWWCGSKISFCTEALTFHAWFCSKKPYFLPSNDFLTCNVAKLLKSLLGMQYFTFHIDFWLVSNEHCFTLAHVHEPNFNLECSFFADVLGFLSCLLFLYFFSLFLSWLSSTLFFRSISCKCLAKETNYGGNGQFYQQFCSNDWTLVFPVALSAFCRFSKWTHLWKALSLLS